MPDIAKTPSPNFDTRPQGQKIDMLVLHYTGMKSAQAALERLTDPSAKVSAHYVIDEQGAMTQLVDEQNRAWHTGVSHWAGQDRLNDCSIGIELVNPGHEFGYQPFPEAQMAALEELAAAIIARHNIPATRVLGHSDIAPERKQDPGELFDWKCLADKGIGYWLEPAPIKKRAARIIEGDQGQQVSALQTMLAIIGYGVEVNSHYDAQTMAAIAAFQRHFRPEKVDGIADHSTLDTLHRCIQGLE